MLKYTEMKYTDSLFVRLSMEVNIMNRLVMMVLKNFWRVPGAWIKLCRYANNTDKYPEQEKWDHIQYILKLAVTGGNVDLQVHGLENIPAPGTGGFIMYSNHQGLFDVVAIAATCKTPLGAVMKKELTDVPLLKQIRECTHSFAMDREDVRQSLTVIQNVTEEVKNGRSYVIFPEGTRSKTGEMADFKAGAFRIAQKNSAPVVPFFIDKTDFLLERNHWRIKGGDVAIGILPMIDTSEYAREDWKALPQLAEDMVREALESYRAEKGKGEVK